MKLPGFKFGKKKARADSDDDDESEDTDREPEEDEPDETEAADETGSEDEPAEGVAEDVEAAEVEAEEGGGDEATGPDVPDDDAIGEDDEGGEEEEEKVRKGAGKGRLITLVGASIGGLAVIGGAAWWFMGGDGAPDGAPERDVRPGVPRVVLEVPPKSQAPAGGLLTPPSATGPGPATAVAAGATAAADPGSLNAIASSVIGPGAGVVVLSVTQAAFAGIPEPPTAQPLSAVPDPALVEESPQGPLPKVAEDGRMAWQAYAAPFDAKDSRPRIATIIAGLGLSRAATEAAINRLPAAVTLAFDPYAKGLSDWVSLARQAGHEILLSLPMEPADFPLRDPGPLALLTSLEPADNLQRLELLLGRLSGYVGVITVLGSQFTTVESQVRPLLEALKGRGLLYVDSGTTPKTLAPKIAGEIDLPAAVNSLVLDGELTRAAVENQLTTLEGIARRRTRVVAVASPYPVIIERIAAWAQTLEAKNLVLAPVSAVAGPQAKK